MPRKIDITGKRFGRLVAISEASIVNHVRNWLFKCDCGNLTEKRKGDVLCGATRSCGCMLNEKLALGNPKHGMCGTPEYHAWQAMINRCTNQNYPSFHCYGGRGIIVCDQWMKFENFFADMGNRPSSLHSLDRKETNGNYEQNNCRWATKQEQSNNMRKNIFIEHNGKRQTMSEWAREIGIRPSALWRRLNIKNLPIGIALQP